MTPDEHSRTHTFTPSETSTVETTVAGWPVDWFSPKITWDHNGPGEQGRYNYVVLEQSSGPWFGEGFWISKQPAGFVVSLLGHYDQKPELWTPVGTVEEALEAIREFIMGSVESWGLKIAA